jgi:hypothetical protein
MNKPFPDGENEKVALKRPLSHRKSITVSSSHNSRKLDLLPLEMENKK